MRKILFIFVLSVFVFVIYGCKPSVPVDFYNYVEYMEKLKLRGKSSDFFVEVTIGQSHGKNFCKIVLIPINLNTVTDNLSYVYGNKQGSFEKELTTAQYFGVIENYDKSHNYLLIKTSVDSDSIALSSICSEFPSDQLLVEAYNRFEHILHDEFENKKIQHKIYLKILSDMSGNAFYYISFVGNKDFLAVLFDIDTLEIIADYIK